VGTHASVGLGLRSRLPTWRFAHKRRIAARAAFDLAAETFVRVLGRVDTFNPEQGLAMAWVLRIARNLLIDVEPRRAVDDRARQQLGIGRVALTSATLPRSSDLRMRVWPKPGMH
jgi:RNA polymerase sigma-70 factor (ECF subfamily)